MGLYGASKTAEEAHSFLKNLIEKAPFVISKILTDNGKEFTDRFCPTGEREPTGKHLFDQECAEHSIEHRLIKPRKPQTNGMAERFNGRIKEIIQQTRFESAQQLEETLIRYLDIYNSNIPQRNLGHVTPMEALSKWRKTHPDLFKKSESNHPGLDTQTTPMPELPEVEVTRLGLLPHLPGRKIVTLFCSGKRLRLPMPPLEAHICGRTIAALARRAKYLLIRMDNGSVLVVHLGMTGKLGLFPKAAARAAHDHLCLELDSGLELRFNDARRFGSVMLWPSAEAAQMEEIFTQSQGLEPFSPEFTAAHLARLAEGRRQPIKTFLMDGRRISGIGNIYANETLFAAKIHPQTPAGSLSVNQWQRIADCAVMILKRAIAAGGSTISDFLGSSGQPGLFQLQLAVYGRQEQPCSVCGQKISKEQLGGRATFFCLSCQELLE